MAAPPLSTSAERLAERRQLLQLETLYDLAVTLHSHRSEEQLLEELLQQVCAVLDPTAALAVTRDEQGAARAVAAVGWRGGAVDGSEVLADPLWAELQRAGRLLSRQDGRLADQPYREVLLSPLAYRGTLLGCLALLDKEARGEEEPGFSEDDRRFLDSVASLAGVSLDSARQVEQLEAQRERLEEENRALKSQLVEQIGGQRIIAQAPALRTALEVAERVAPRGLSVLLRGESGTGKELVAKLLHVRSGRRGPLIALNCAALPDSLLESELFGIERGVATGVDARPGKFELADGGTLFLDEIGDMPLTVQVRLLRVLQEREVVRVGGRRPVRVDVRMIAATHRNLAELIVEGRFREDLFYRLKGVELALPPLRERREDIPHLVRYFATEFCRREGISVPALQPEALGRLMHYDYPGNVRELRNLVEGAVSLADGEITSELIDSLTGSAGTPASAAALAPSPPGAPDGPLDLESVNRAHIARVLQLTAGNKSAAARLLGVNRRTLLRQGY